jgi:alpha-glucosidase
MQWDGRPNAGFCPVGVEPWLPLADGWGELNVAAQDLDGRSVLSLFKALIRLRRSHEPLAVGTYRSVDVATDDVFAYVRSTADSRLLVALNFGGRTRSIDPGAIAPATGVLISTELDRAYRGALTRLDLRPNEGVVVSLAGESRGGSRWPPTGLS